MMSPPFTITTKMLNQIVEISQYLGQLQVQYERPLHLRKNNRIRTIQASLAIENNTLSLEQVTDIIDGKKVFGNPKEIQEVKNAFDTYEKILEFDPFSLNDFLLAHRMMTQGLVNQSGTFRQNDVGIFDNNGNVLHMGARPSFIPNQMQQLFDWAKNDDTPALIKSAVMHYEIEVIHPFEDGNGRMGRFWQSVLLSDFNSLFAWLPVESMVYQHQQRYYAVLRQADSANNSTVFIEFMFEIILQTLFDYQNDKMSDKLSDKLSDNLSDKFVEMSEKLSPSEQQIFKLIVTYLLKHTTINNQQAQAVLGKSSATVRRYLTMLVEKGILVASGQNKARYYTLVDKD